MKIKASHLKFTAITLVIIVSLTSLVYWLWQRQPMKENLPSVSEATQEAKISDENKEINLNIAPKSGLVLKEKTTTLQFETLPSEFVTIYSNFNQSVGKTNENGKLDIQIELKDGLNLINVSTLNDNLEEEQSQPLVYYVQKNPSATTVFAGPVKNVFDEVITIITATGEQTIREKTSTKLILPSGENDKEDGDIRVGDYVIALGSIENDKDFNTTSIEIIRDNKPQVLENMVAGTILSEVKNNLFSVRNQKDSNISELIADEKTTMSQNGKKVNINEVVKDQKAIILYSQQQNENIADLIYLLP